jgi:hypothetical protein
MPLQATCVELTSRCWGPRDPLLLSVPLMPVAQWECDPAPLGPSLRPDNKTECPKVEVINSRSRRCDWRLQRCELPIVQLNFLNIESTAMAILPIRETTVVRQTRAEIIILVNQWLYGLKDAPIESSEMVASR